jgi:hypothetical protein
MTDDSTTYGDPGWPADSTGVAGEEPAPEYDDTTTY